MTCDVIKNERNIYWKKYHPSCKTILERESNNSSNCDNSISATSSVYYFLLTEIESLESVKVLLKANPWCI